MSAVPAASLTSQPTFIIHRVPLVGHLPLACNLEVPTCVYQSEECYTDYIGYTTTLTKNRRSMETQLKDKGLKRHRPDRWKGLHARAKHHTQPSFRPLMPPSTLHSSAIARKVVVLPALWNNDRRELFLLPVDEQ
jgi:hypothetical protein